MWNTSFAMVIGLASCHPAMMNDEEGMRAYLNDARRETVRHAEATRAATTISDVRAEVSRHRDGMTPMMLDIDSAAEGMVSHCDGTGVADMSAMHGELDDELARHLGAMATIEDLAAVTAEVDRHEGTALSIVDDMGGAMGRMRCW